MAQWAYYLGKKFDNASLIADGWHHRSDALSSIPVLIGIVISKFFEVWWMDGVLGIIIALMLFYATYHIMHETINKLLGEMPSKDLINSIKKAVADVYPENMELHHFHLHNYVSHKELTFHIRLDGSQNIKTGHEIASRIEDIIEKNFGMTATVHVEPLGRELNKPSI
jgi:cation diffusion facilitator family transporter